MTAVAVLQSSPWLHDVEHFTADEAGYIYWKGAVVEHYDNYCDPKWKAVLEDLALRCRHVESLGIKPRTSNVIWRWETYKDLRRDNPYFDLIVRGFYLVMINGDKTLFIVSLDDGEIAVALLGNETMTIEFYSEEWEPELYQHYHNQGWQIPDVGQTPHTGVYFGKCDRLTAFFKQRNVPVDLHQQIAAQKLRQT